MKNFLVSASIVAMLMAGLATQPLNAAEDEVKGAVPARTDANNPDSAVYRASDIMNMPVKNDAGAEVGHIKDLVINGESREVLYAVVAMNDAKEKDALYVMPWQVFQPYYGQGNALQYTVLTLPQSVWLQAPFYSASQWRSVGYSQWGPRVNTYYSSHINQRVNVNGRSTNVKAAKPVINDSDLKDPSRKTDRTDKKGDTNKNDKPAPKSDSDKESPPPKTVPTPNPVPKPTPNPTPAPKGDAPAAPKTPAVKDPVPGAPKAPSAPLPRAPKTESPK